MNRSRPFLLTTLLTVTIVLGGVGCKSACEKAVERMISCFDAWCTDHPNDPMCTESTREVGIGELRETLPDSCTGRAQERSRAMIEMSCEDIRSGQWRE